MNLGEVQNLGAAIKVHIERGNTALANAECHHMAAGKKLIEARAEIENRNDVNWLAFLAHCGIGKTRAYQLIAIADGSLTQEDIRAANRVRDRLRREKSAAHGKAKSPLGDQDILESITLGFAGLGYGFQNEFLAAHGLMRVADIRQAA